MTVKQRLEKQRLEFSTFLHFNLVKVYACNSISDEDYLPANTVCTQAARAPVARAASRSFEFDMTDHVTHCVMHHLS